MNLKEFASHLGLSQTTVSRALSGYPEVRAETRDRVMRAARELGYRPNTAAIGLATGRAGAIGIVLRGTGFGPHATEFLGGLGGRLQADDIDMLISTVESEEAELAIYRRLAASKRVDGFVLHSPGSAIPAFRCCRSSACPSSCMAARKRRRTVVSSISTIAAPRGRRPVCWSISATAASRWSTAIAAWSLPNIATRAIAKRWSAPASLSIRP